MIILGLDAYAFAVDKEDAINDISFKYQLQDEFFYVRKDFCLNNYMLNLYYMKGGIVAQGEFSVRLTNDDLQKFKYDITHNNIPSGYRLNSKKDSIMNYLRLIKDAKKAITAGKEVYYVADW